MKLPYPFFFFLFLTLISGLTLISATTAITGNFVYDNPTLPHLNPTLNASLVTVNNSIYWSGYLPTTLPHNILAGIQGGSPGQYYHLNQSFFDQVISFAFSWITGENVGYTNQSNNWTGNQNINGNLNVNGTITGTINATISTANFSYYSNNSAYLNGYNSTTLPHNGLAGLQGGNANLSEYYHLDLTQFQDVTNFSNATTQKFVPYQGAINNVNLTGFNLTASNMFVPIGGSVNWDNNITANGTTVAYMRYNTTSMRLEMWVNGKIQQDWGNSTTIYGTATFQSDAFFQNLSGVGLLINTNVIVDGSITANQNITGQSIFAGNLCYSDGTNCTYINTTIGNLTQLIYSINQTLSMQIYDLYNITQGLNSSIYYINQSLYQINSSLYNYTTAVNESLTNQINNETAYRIANDSYLQNQIDNITTNFTNNFYDKSHDVTPLTNMTFNLGNSTNWWSSIYVATINSINMFIDTINARIINVDYINATNISVGSLVANNLSGILHWTNLTGIPYYLNTSQGPYLYDINQIVYFNETQLNATIAISFDILNQSINVTNARIDSLNASINLTNYNLNQINTSLYNMIVNVNGTLYNYTFSVNESLTNMINNETAYRIANDSYLYNLIVEVNGTLYNYTFSVNESLTNMINNETAYRISNDTYLLNLINNETAYRISNDSYLDNLILNVNGTLYNYTSIVNSSLTALINNETLYRIANDSYLQNQITSVNNSLANYYDKQHNVTPLLNMTYSLGNSTNWWTNIWVATINSVTAFINTLNAITINTITLNATNVTTDYAVVNKNLAVGLNQTNATAEIKGNSTNIPITFCNNTVACYRYEEGSGTIAVDSSQYLNLGFIKSDTYAASKGTNGTGNYSLDSVTASGYMVANDQPQLDITDNLTVSAWINVTSNSNNNYIIVKNNDKTLQNGYMFYLQGDKKLYFTVVRNGVTISNLRTVDSSTLALNTGWHHVAATINGSTVVFYIDGVVKPSQAGGQSLAGVSTDLFVGTDGTVTKYFNGYIDEVGIFNTVLTPIQVSTLFNTGFTFVNGTFPGFSNPPFAITRTTMGDVVVVDRYGRVGINNPNPTATLDVNGSANFLSAHIIRDLFVGGTIIGGSPVKISGGLIIYGGELNASDVNASFANIYDKDTVDNTFLNITTANDTYIPYNGGTQDINFSGVNVTVEQLIIPAGGDLHFSNDSQVNYITYNTSSKRVELWANGKIQQDWGNSTTIYGKATFQADAFFQNLSGEGLFVNTNMIVDGNIRAFQNISGSYIFSGNLCYSDGTNCTSLNGTLGNLTQLIFSMNATLTAMINNETDWRIANDTYLQYQIDNLTYNLSTNFYTRNESDAIYAILNGSNTFNGNQNPGLNDTYSLGNSTNIWSAIYVNVVNAISMTIMTLNVNWINVGTVNATSIYTNNITTGNLNASTITADNLNVGNFSANISWSQIQGIPYYINATNSSYLYNVNGTVYFNETLNNQTIADIANINAFQQTVIVTVLGGSGFNISTPINYYLTQLIVTAPDNLTTFNFQATQNNATGYMIDKDRMQHLGHWNIEKDYSLTNDTIYLNIFNASQDGAYTILIKYINAKYPYL